MDQTKLTSVSVSIEPTRSNEWKVEGPRNSLRIRLSDSGGWDVNGNMPTSEHFAMLHHALLRAYNLAIGLTK